MKFKMPGQLRGPECRAVMKAAIAIRKELEPTLATIHCADAEFLNIVLRVAGSLGDFGPEGVSTLTLDDKALDCELQIADHNWGEKTHDEIRTILSALLLSAFEACFRRVGIAESQLSNVAACLQR